MKTDKNTELKNKILYGFDLAIKKLIQKKIKEDGELIFFQNGKIVKIKARDL